MSRRTAARTILATPAASTARAAQTRRHAAVGGRRARPRPRRPSTGATRCRTLYASGRTRRRRSSRRARRPCSFAVQRGRGGALSLDDRRCAHRVDDIGCSIHAHGMRISWTRRPSARGGLRAAPHDAARATRAGGTDGRGSAGEHSQSSPARRRQDRRPLVGKPGCHRVRSIRVSQGFLGSSQHVPCTSFAPPDRRTRRNSEIMTGLVRLMGRLSKTPSARNTCS